MTLGAQILEARGEPAGRRAAASAPELSQSERWDRFVEEARGSDLVQTTAWTDTKRVLGFTVSRVVARSGDEILGGAHIVTKRFGPLGVGYIARGPLVRDGCAEAPRILEEIECAARSERIHHLIIQPPEGGTEIERALAARGYAGDAPAVAPAATLRIDLSQNLEQILAAMATRRRREVRRVERQKIEVRMGGGADISAFHAMHMATARRQNFTPLSRAYLQHQWDILHPKGWLQLFLAYHEGRPLAGIWVTAFGDTVTYRVPGWTGEQRDLRLNVAGHWHAIQWAKAKGFRYYDLGGIDRRFAEALVAGQSIPEALLRSPAGFKILFGGAPVVLPIARQFTFNPFARLVGRFVFSQHGLRNASRHLAHYLRNGRSK